MIIEFRCAPADRHGVTARLDIRDVAAADAPVAIRCSREHYHDELIDLRWWDGRLWASPRPGFRDDFVHQIRQDLKHAEPSRYQKKDPAEVAAAMAAILARRSASVIAVDGVLHTEEPKEPYWKYGSDYQNKYGLRLHWDLPGHLDSGYGSVSKSFRADRLHVAIEHLRHDHRGDVPVLNRCDVLMPEVLRHDPERLWWKNAFVGVRQGIAGALNNVPPRGMDEVADGIGDAIRAGIDELARKGGLSRHHIMRIMARITDPRDGA